MNRLKMAAVAVLLSIAASARAQQVLTVETKWNEITVSTTITGVTSATFDIGGFGGFGYAGLGNAAKFNGTNGTTFGQSTVVTSTWTNVVAFDYVFYASATLSTTFPGLQIAQTVSTPPPPGANAKNPASFNTNFPGSLYSTVPVISTSSVITEPNGVLVQNSFRARVQNPIFYLTGLTSGATYVLTVDYGVPAHY